MNRSALLSFLFAGCPAFAQSFNVDLNTASGAGAGAPASTFKAAAGQAGFWNAVGSQTTFSLSDLNGAASAVTLTRSGGGTTGNNSSAALTGDDEKLLEDAFVGSSGVTVTFSFNNLQAGTYALYTYAVDPSSVLTSTVNVTGSTSQSNQAVGSFMSGPSYFVGATHALHVLSVAAGGTITATIAPTSTSAEIAGFQLRKLPGTLLRIHVDDSAAGAGNGASWADAFNNPVTALSTARVAAGQNCEVWVANGFYKPTTTTDRYASFDVPSMLKFYGGFAGSENSLSERTSLSLCYLNGEIGNAATKTDNCYVVVNADFTASGTVIDGFRIHNGYNDEGSVGGGQGGGMRLLSGSAQVRNCTFVGNYASNYGAGVYVHNGTPIFADCLFYQNESFRGAGIYTNASSPVRMYNCEFLDHNTFDGAAYLNGGLTTLAGCYFHGNYAGNTGGAVNATGGIVTLAGCTIAGNSAGGAAGGLYARGNASVGIQNSIFWGNLDAFSGTQLEKQYDNENGSVISAVNTTAEGAAGSNGLNPLFIDGNGADNVWGTFDDNCRLQAGSPARDTGSNANITNDFGDLDEDGVTAEAIPFDFDGAARIRNTIVDRGAFEFQPPCDLAGDLDGDNDVDLTDLATLLGHFGTPSGGTAANGDIDGDGDIDLSDLTSLLSTFGQTCP